MDRTQATVLRARFAVNLKNARRLAGYTQARLAEAAGMHTMAVQFFERKVNAPTLDSLELLAKALNLEPQILILTPADALVGMAHLAEAPNAKAPPKKSSRGRVARKSPTASKR